MIFPKNNTQHVVITARDKVVPLEKLGSVVEAHRTHGKKIVLCHGVYDLVHLGHVRHLEAARREGDILIVSITSDDFVNKGPGRPIFPDHMRAEMLAALAYVDYVTIKYGPSANPVLDNIRPDVYVKGSDYENPDEDITGKIQMERETVEKHGGKMVFTKDITFSSSTLINRYLDVYDPPLRDFLENMRGKDSLNTLINLIESVKDCKILLVGDAIIDDYQYVETMGKSAKESMIASSFKGREIFAGGVIAAANHVAGFCDNIEVISAIGLEDSYEAEIRKHALSNINLNLVRVEGRPTTRKTRFLEHSYSPRKLFEVYYMDDTPMGTKKRSEIDSLIAERAAEADVVIVTDFGHGLIRPSTVETLIEHSKFLAVNVQTNSGNQGYNLVTKFRKADLICIDAPEARLAAGEKFSDIPEIIENHLTRLIDCDKIVVTHGSHGCYAYAKGEGLHRIPAFAKNPIDTVGAGDAFFAVMAPMIAQKGSIEEAAFIGNAAGAMKVGIVGHRNSVEKIPLVKFVTALLK